METNPPALILALFLAACSGGHPANSTPGGANDAGPDTGADAEPSSADPALLEVMTRVAHYELLQLGAGADNDWVNAVCYVGLLASYSTTGDADTLKAVQTWSAAHSYALHTSRKGPRFADDQCCTQAYLDLDLLSAAPAGNVATQAAQNAFDAMIAQPAPGRQDWYWADALFMAPGSLARLGAVSGDPKYAAFLNTAFWDAEANLLSAKTGLFWRDQTFFGTNVYWSRGNGWVAAGAVRVLQYLPADDPRRADYVALLQSLAKTVAPLQGTDGLWRADLLNPSAFPNPETSGSALFTYAMAWGIEQGVLERASYLPVVERAWSGLVGAVDAQGRLGWVQPSGIQPAAATAQDSYPYGVGAFLLAGSEVAKLK